jgi:hypothetical protein
MSEIGVTLSRFLMMRSAGIVPALMASYFSAVEEVHQAMIGWMAAVFLAFLIHGVKSVRAACLQGMLPIMAFALV